MNLYTAVNNVLKRLDDYPVVAGQSMWTRGEVELYVKDGYDAFCRQTKCLLDFFYPENLPAVANYTAKWERAYMTSGMIAQGLLNFSGGPWEADYAEAAASGPASITQPWEATDGDDLTLAVTTLKPIPENTVVVDRVTHDFRTLDGEFTRFFEQEDRNFQTTAGEPSNYSLDRDGLPFMRLVPKGDGAATTYTTSGTYGLLRDAEDTDGFTVWVPSGSWGVLRQFPEHFSMGGSFGIPRRLYSDTNNTRVEYWRLGKDPDEYALELPDRFVKYVEFYAAAKALERDGPGQDMALSAHFMSRFADGVSRMVKRLGENKRAMIGQIGGTAKVPTKPALARLPWRYGRQIRRAY